MPRLEITEEDRDERGRIMVEAQNRAAERETPPEAPASAPPAHARKLSNRRGQSAPALSGKSQKRTIGPIAGVLIAALLIGVTMRLSSTPIAGRQPPATAPGPVDQGAPALVAHPAPTEAAGATIDAYAAPDGVLLGPIDARAPIVYRYGATSWGGVVWQGKVVWIRADHTPPKSYPDLAPPTPAPTPIIVRVEVPVDPPCDVAVNPRYTATIDVGVAGVASGRSCASQADAQSDAERQAAEIRRANPALCQPGWKPPMQVPESCK